MKHRIILLIVILACFLVSAWPNVISDLLINVRLTTSLSSQHSHAGDSVETVVLAPVLLQGRVALPSGSVVKGSVEAVRGLSERHRRAGLLLRFDEVTFPNGETLAIEGRVTAVDNARETVSSEGWIDGQRPFAVKPTKIQDLFIILAHAHPLALAALEGVQFIRREAAHLDIVYKPGVDLTLRTPIPDVSQNVMPVEAPEMDGKLFDLVQTLPLRAASFGYVKPADVTNIVLIGSRSDVERAFAAAGWTATAKLNLGSGMRTFFAVAEQHPYRRAPVSTLFLYDRNPDLVFQKQTDTMAKRHHIRLWQETSTLDGQPVWVGAATHDVAITFSASKGFTHRIDASVDLERTKVIDDLIFSGEAMFRGLVDRPKVPHESVNASGDPVRTDGRIAILSLSGWRSAAAAN